MALRSPTARLLAGLTITLAAVAFFSWYTLRQVAGLERLQTNTVERNRKDSLQLLRIQNNLHALALAMRDMVEGSEPYPLEAWKTEFDRLRFDLNDALKLESQLAPATRTPEQQLHLAGSLEQFWSSADEMFLLARAARDAEARRLIRASLQPRQAALTSATARLLVENNEAEEEAARQIQRIHQGVERNIYLFLAAMLVAVSSVSLYLIYTNRSIFERLAALSDQRRTLARKLITMQEEILRSVSRELHDEFGQILTAMGAMLGRAERKAPPEEQAMRAELTEVRQIAQETLDKMRSLSQAFHPTILDDYGLERALEWYSRQFEKLHGIVIRYEKSGDAPVVADTIAIHVYRVLQESLNNVARHSTARQAWVRVRFSPRKLHLEVEDHGVGWDRSRPPAGGLGLIAMKERAEILQGRIEIAKPAAGGTLVSLDIPLPAE